MPEFREILKKERTARAWSQYNLAEMAGVNHSAVSLWEAGARNPSADSLARLSCALDVSVEYLLGRKTRREKV